MDILTRPARYGLTCSLVLLLTQSAFAHFLWLANEQQADGQSFVHVYFGEDASPDDPELLTRLQGMKGFRYTARQSSPQEIEWKLSEEGLKATVNSPAPAIDTLSHTYGLFSRGENVFLLKYEAKTGPEAHHPLWKKALGKTKQSLELLPEMKGGKLTITAQWKGTPLAAAEYHVSVAGQDDLDGVTDEAGRFTLVAKNDGRYSIRVRQVENQPGQYQGKDYKAVRTYSTLTLDVNREQPSAVGKTAGNFPDMPAPVTSFGGAILGDQLYVYGGHLGDAHEYSNELQSGTLSRLDLKDGDHWEVVSEGPHLQGLALVPYNGKLYRVGGFSAMNAKGEEHVLVSQNSVVAFDPQTGQWSALPPLPEPRSSHDAVVLGSKLYVAGGWQLRGTEDAVWLETAYVIDLADKTPTWQPLPRPPFQRRAVALATQRDRIYVIGGMQPVGGPVTRVDAFNTATGQWETAPALQGEQGIEGFGTAAFENNGRLYVSTIKGRLQCLSDDGQQWEVVRTLPTARFFHRMLPWGNDRFVVLGGANMSIGKFVQVELLDVGGL
mgnify:FL=1